MSVYMNNILHAAWGLLYLDDILIRRFKISLLSNKTSKNIYTLNLFEKHIDIFKYWKAAWLYFTHGYVRYFFLEGKVFPLQARCGSEGG